MNMNHRKKITALIGALTLALTLCACGDTTSTNGNTAESSIAEHSIPDSSESESSSAESADAADVEEKAQAVSADSSGNDSSAAESREESKAEQKTDKKADSDADASSVESGGEDAPADDTPAQAEDVPAKADDEFKIGKKMAIGIEPFTAKAGQKAVPVSFKVWNNTGFAAGGIKVYYDAALKPVLTGKESPNGIPIAKADLSDLAPGMINSCLVKTEDHLLAIGVMSTENVEGDGTFITCYFDVPDTAKSGTKYEFKVNIDALNSKEMKALSVESVNGYLTVE